MYVPEDDEREDDVDVEEQGEDAEESEDQYDEEGDDADGEEEDGSGDEAEPQDLADAFDRIRQMDAEDTADDVEGDGDSNVEDPDGAGEGGDEGPGEDPDASDVDGYDYGGGSPDVPDPSSYVASQRAIVDQINRQAVAAARKQFSDEGIREFTMEDLYERTQDGRVIYKNPDDPNRPFSSRMEAQQWIDSFNQQLQNELVRVARGIRDQHAKAAMPALMLLQFAPTYDAMPTDVKEIFDDLISDYEIRNRGGKVIGYSCNLEKMAARAIRMSEKYSSPKQSRRGSGKVVSKPPRQPATDMRSHGSSCSSSHNDDEPATMEEAMKRLREIERRRK